MDGYLVKRAEAEIYGTYNQRVSVEDKKKHLSLAKVQT